MLYTLDKQLLMIKMATAASAAAAGGVNMPIDIHILWLIGVVVFAVLEGVTYQMISIWFMFGAMGGLIASLVTDSFLAQMVVFLAISILLLAVLRPLSMKLVKNQDFKSNTDGLIGKEVLITQEVSNIKGTGQGKINGMVWTVRSEDDIPLPAGETAKIERIEGVKLIVSAKR